MEHRIRLNLASTALIIVLGVAVSVITSTTVAARAYTQRAEKQDRGEQTMMVKGSTRKRVRSDKAVWRIDVRGEHADLKEAYKIVEQGAGGVREFLKSHGFSEAELSTGAIETLIIRQRDKEGHELPEIASYQLERTFWITTGDVDRVAAAAGKVTALIEQGVMVISMAPQYYYSDLTALKIELMGAASRDARARADEIAKNAGCRVAEVRSASMGVLQVTRPLSTDVSDSGIYDTGTIDKDVQAVVTIVFRIESL